MFSSMHHSQKVRAPGVCVHQEFFFLVLIFYGFRGWFQAFFILWTIVEKCFVSQLLGQQFFSGPDRTVVCRLLMHANSWCKHYIPLTRKRSIFDYGPWKKKCLKSPPKPIKVKTIFFQKFSKLFFWVKKFFWTQNALNRKKKFVPKVRGGVL